MLVTFSNTLLVVDNNVESRKQLAAELAASFDFEGQILEASTARECLALCDTHSIDCVVLNFDVHQSNDALAIGDYMQDAKHQYRPMVFRAGAGYELLAVSDTQTMATNVRSHSSHSVASLVQKIQQSIEQRQSDEAVVNENNKWKAECSKLALANQELISSCHVVAHNMKNPLFAASELVALTLEEIGGPLNEQQSEFLGAAQDSFVQIDGLLNDWLNALEDNTKK